MKKVLVNKNTYEKLENLVITEADKQLLEMFIICDSIVEELISNK